MIRIIKPPSVKSFSCQEENRLIFSRTIWELCRLQVDARTSRAGRDGITVYKQMRHLKLVSYIRGRHS